ncbi:MAG: hypothetical protein ACYDD1_21490, partial [Caulobacteraceae bacterium]
LSMKFARLIAALFGCTALASVGAASPALATIQYNSDNPINGLDATSTSSPPAGWVSNSGTWIAAPPSTTSASCTIVPSHSHGLGDSSKTNKSVATYTGAGSYTDQEVAYTHVLRIATGNNIISDVYAGLRGDSGATIGYLAGVSIPTAGSTALSLTIFKRTASGTYTSEATQIGAVTLPSNIVGGEYTLHSRTAVVGSVVYAKVWLDGSAEPNAWQVSWTDTSPIASGYPWVYNVTNDSIAACATDFTLNDVPFGEPNSLLMTSPAPTKPGVAISGQYAGTVPTGINYALDGATTFTTATGFSASGGTFSFALPNASNGYHQITVQAANATTETSATPAFDAVGLGMGTITATPAYGAGIVLAASSGLVNGTGTGYAYNIYRGTDPAFTEGAGTLLAGGVTSLPYTDATAVAGVQYYYGVNGYDSSNTIVQAVPVGLGAPTAGLPYYSSAQLLGQDLNVVFIGDSRTFCQYCSVSAIQGTVNLSAGSATPPYWASKVIQKSLGLRNVNAFNGGCSGSSSNDWLKGAAAHCTEVNGYDQYAWAAGTGSTTGMAALVAADPSALQVFSINLDANDAYQALSQTTFTANMRSLIVSLLTDWPNAIIIVNEGSYFTPSIYGGAAVTSLAYSYRSTIPAMIAGLQAAYPGRTIRLGDTNAWNYFAINYPTEMASQVSYAGAQYGTGFLHQNDIGSQTYGTLWGQAIAQTLYGTVASLRHFGSLK